MSRTTFPPLEDDFTRALLRSAEADEPSHAAYAKAAAALGVGAGIGVGASLAAPSAVAAGAAGVARWSGVTATRLWALGVSGALLVGAGALLLNARAPSGNGAAAAGSNKSGAASQAALPAVASAASAAPPTSVPAADAPAAPAAVSAEGESSVAALVPAVAPVEARASGNVARRPSALKPTSGFVAAFARAQASPSSSLAEQVQSLDRARVALGSGDAGSALQEISRYRKAWPQGVFLTEASVLEIEALAARGERSLAATRAASFVAAHPDSPQAERLRRLIPTEKR